MSRVFCLVVAQIVVLGCCALSIYLLAPRIGQWSGIPAYASGWELILVFLICIFSVAVGFTVGIFAFPLVLRPFVSSATFWQWAGRERSLKIPVIDPIHNQWCRLLYGARRA
jgi:hypothetical protein